MEWKNCWCASLPISKQMRSRIYYFTAIGLMAYQQQRLEKFKRKWRLKREKKWMKIPTRFSWSSFFSRSWRFVWWCSRRPPLNNKWVQHGSSRCFMLRKVKNRNSFLSVDQITIVSKRTLVFRKYNTNQKVPEWFSNSVIMFPFLVDGSLWSCSLDS